MRSEWVWEGGGYNIEYLITDLPTFVTHLFCCIVEYRRVYNTAEALRLITEMDSDLELSDNDNADDDADDDSDFDATQEETNAAVADDSSADEEDNVDDAVVAGANKRRCLWKIGGNFTPKIFPYVENQDHHVDFSTINYFDQYIHRHGVTGDHGVCIKCHVHHGPWGTITTKHICTRIATVHRDYLDDGMHQDAQDPNVLGKQNTSQCDCKCNAKRSFLLAEEQSEMCD